MTTKERCGVKWRQWFLIRSLMLLVALMPSTRGEVVESADVMPKVTSQPRPIYPFAMRRAGITGEVLINFVVDTDGRVAVAHVERASHPGFREAALDSVYKWRFKPAMLDGRKVAARMRVPMIFNITGGDTSKGWQVKRPKSHPESLPEAFRWHKPPELVWYAAPVYPRQAVLDRQGATVLVKFVVDAVGRVIATEAEGDADAAFKHAAEAAVRSFRFNPAAHKSGAPCGAILSMEFDFRPNNDRSDAPYTSEMRRVAKLLREEPDQIRTLKDLPRPPIAVAQREPTVPVELMKTPRPAEALVEFVITRNGVVVLPQIVSTTDEAFGYAALQAVADWGFAPPYIGDEPVDVVARIPLVYKPPAVEEAK